MLSADDRLTKRHADCALRRRRGRLGTPDAEGALDWCPVVVDQEPIDAFRKILQRESPLATGGCHGDRLSVAQEPYRQSGQATCGGPVACGRTAGQLEYSARQDPIVTNGHIREGNDGVVSMPLCIGECLAGVDGIRAGKVRRAVEPFDRFRCVHRQHQCTKPSHHN